MISAYKPTSYAPTNVTNGTSGATTPESQRNAAMQIPQSGSTANPYAEAVTHTLNWMQYQAQPQPTQAQYMGALGGMQKAGGGTPTSAPQAATAPMTSGGSAWPTTYQDGVGPNGEPLYVGTGALPMGGAPIAGTQEIGQGTGAGGGGTPTTPGTNQQPTPGGSTTPTTPGGTPTTPGGNTRPDPGHNPPLGPADPTAWMQDEVNKYAKTPGFEWVAQYPQAFHMFAAEQQRNGTVGKGPTFEEWLSNNWEDVSAKLKLTPQQQEQWGYGVRQKGYQSWATRLRNDYAAGGGKEDTQWVTPEMVKNYDQWLRWARSTNGAVEGLSFWEWAGSVNKGIDPTTGKPIPPGSGTTPDDPTKPKDPMAGSRVWGNRNSTTTPGTPTGNPGGAGSLEDFIRSLRDQGAKGRDDALRQFRHEAGLSGLNDMGAYNPALGTLIQDSIRDENSAIYEIMNAKDEGERQRALEKYIAELQAKTSVESASIGASGAQYAADRNYQASIYDADIRKALGLAGLDVDREGNYWRNQLGMQDLMLRYLQMIYGTSPDQIIGGNPVPGGDGW